MKVIFVAYRNWAIEVYPFIKNHPKICESILLTDYEDLYKIDVTKYDLLITVGLSKIIGNGIYDKIETIGLHCAELDKYSYGSPIQHQLIDGILKTKHRIFRLTSGDGGSKRSHAHSREYANEVDLFLHGGINQIFDQMKYTAIGLINSFIDFYPNVIWSVWPEEEEIRMPRNEGDSLLTMSQFASYTTLQLYNLIRGLEDPYPNLRIEDEEGTLFFKKVTFKQKLNEK